MESARLEDAGSMQRIHRSSAKSKSSDFSIESLVGQVKEESPIGPVRQKQAAARLESEDLDASKYAASASLLCSDVDSSSLPQTQQAAWGPEAVNYWSQLASVSPRLQPLFIPSDSQTCFFVTADYPAFMNQIEGTNAQVLFATDGETQAIPASIWARQCFQLLKQVNPLLLRQQEADVDINNTILLQPFPKPKRNRTAFSPFQLVELERAFDSNHYVVGNERRDLASRLQLSETQVKVWFQNRRTKHKRGKPEKPSLQAVNGASPIAEQRKAICPVPSVGEEASILSQIGYSQKSYACEKGASRHLK